MSVSDEIRSRLDEPCLLSRFISAVTDGLVCFDLVKGEISEFFEKENQPREALTDASSV